MFAVEHGAMNKVMIMSENKLFTINVYDTGFISPKPYTQDISYPVQKLARNLTTPTLIKGGQTLAWINKTMMSINMVRVCSYSEFNFREICYPCRSTEFSLNSKC